MFFFLIIMHKIFSQMVLKNKWEVLPVGGDITNRNSVLLFVISNTSIFYKW